MFSYTNTSLQRLREMLDATNVVSKEFRGSIIGWAHGAASEAYDAGQQAHAERWLERGQVWKRKGDSPVEAVVYNVVRVRRGGPAWEKGTRDYVVLCSDQPWYKHGHEFTDGREWKIDTDEFVRDWNRQS